ncbi:hypothetical protein Dda_4112 [Drechslerella dactyloides]|uniref:Uncharacterized protein n=1 Tax=Drechslerella dactyloides TaxID=74499 RepID=A0AAD6NKF9_DREDA|nr:hypothetical protein Dda_4112 [Drechslerella dactyloides]
MAGQVLPALAESKALDDPICWRELRRPVGETGRRSTAGRRVSDGVSDAPINVKCDLGGERGRPGKARR